MEKDQSWYLTSVKAAIDAGKEILDVYRSKDFQVSLKSDHSPLTLADRKADQTIRRALSTTPYPILSEESGSHDYRQRNTWSDFWLVDPLDGTKEFISKNDEFTVNIALIHNGLPVFGVIYAPVLDQLFIGLHAMGAWRFEHGTQMVLPATEIEPLTSKGNRLPLPDQQIRSVVVSRSHLSDVTRAYVNNLERKTGTLEQVRSGSSLKLCRIAEGTAGIYPRFGPTMEWDIAAGVAIVNAAGGKVTTHEGHALRFNKEDLINPWFIAVSQSFSKRFPDYI